MAADPHIPAKTRTRQTRDWIIASFNRLVLRRRYSDISVAELADRAGVGRSTFYEHFEHKDDVLRSAVRVILEPMADLVREDVGIAGVVAVIVHVREQRDSAMAILAGPVRAKLESQLGELVLERRGERGGPTAMARLLGMQIACAQLGLLRAWLEPADAPCPARAIAEAMRATTWALAAVASEADKSEFQGF
jgi:AcrR family transcriptional regulator